MKKKDNQMGDFFGLYGNLKKKSVLTIILTLGLAFQVYPSHILFTQVEKRELQKTVTGTVVDEKGLPLPGVTVIVEGTNKGTVTNMEGKFQIEVPPEGTLVFSYLGFAQKKVSVENRNIMDVTLEENISSLKEVVVVGYGMIKKSDLTGSVSQISEEDFPKGAQQNAASLLQGKAAGVNVTQADAKPGGGFSIRIRGANSITAGNEPLYVIDGLPGPPGNGLNPGDIASIEILKDASATAIYGSRGANGVILITTKKGQPGDMEISYSGYTGIQEVANRLDLMNSQEYTTFLNGIREDRGQEPLFPTEQGEIVESGTDWQEEIFRSAVVQNHQLAVSGGSDNTGYYVSLNHFEEEGVIINTDFARTTARVNVNHSVDRFNFGINLNTSTVQNQDVPYRGINAQAGVITAALQMDPLMPVFTEDGEYAENPNLDLDNPVAQAETIFMNTKTNRTFGNVFAEYFVLDELSAKINYGRDRATSRHDNYITKITRRGQSTNGSANISASETSSDLIELTLNYNDTVAGDHKINAVAGYSYQDFDSRGFGAGSENFPTDAFLTNNLGAGDQERFSVGSHRSRHQLLSYLGRVNYNFKDTYLITGTFRVDGSSRFGEDQKYGYFPSVALGWKLNQEPFLSEFEELSLLKLRASYGITGNQAIGNYNSLILLGTAGDAVFNGQQFASIAPIQLANPDLRWEKTQQINIGLDYGFFNNRITGSVDYFIKNTSDLLLLLPVPTTTGFTTSLQNVGDTKNSGFEFVVDSKNLTGEFEWSTSLNFAMIENEVTDLGDLPFILQGWERFLTNFTILREGDPINSYYGYQTAGIFQNQEEVDESAQPGASPGDIRFADVNGDGVINSDDRVTLGDPFPEMSYGITNTFSYKGLSLNIFFQGKLGNEMLNFTRIDSENPISFRRNRQAYVLDRWTPENPSNENPSFVNPDISRAVNSRVVEDASYLRLRNVTLNYNFLNLNISGIESLSVYASGQNLLTITNYSGFNPDVSTYGASNLRIDHNAYPLSKIYTLGVNIIL